MKRVWAVLCSVVVILFSAHAVYADGHETFDNFPETSSSYKDGTFIGQDGSMWTYKQSRGDLSIEGKSPCFGKGKTPDGQVYSGTIPGGCATLSFDYKKAFSTDVNLDVKVNDILITTVTASDSSVHSSGDLTVDIAGDVVLKLVQHDANAGQVIVDNVVWTSLGPSGDDPNIVVSSTLNFPQIEAGTTATQDLNMVNNGTSQVLNVTAFLPHSGDTNMFDVGALPSPIGPNNSSDFIQIVYDPGFLTGATHSAVYQLLCNDPSDPTNNVTLSGSTFHGPVTISNIQYTTDPGGASPLLGQDVRVSSAIATYADHSGYVIADACGGPWSGVYVYDNRHRPEIGDEVRVEGTVSEYHNFTEIASVTSYEVLSSSNSVPAAVITTTDLSQEMYEGVLLCVSNVTVNNEHVDDYNWQVQDSSGTCLVNFDSHRVMYRYIPKNGNALTALRGVLWQFDTNYKVQIRDDDDFIGRDVKHYALKGMVVTPDGPKSNWYVEVWDDDIVAVTDAPPVGVTIVDTEGIIFPGLIDAHNHPSYNSFPTLMFDKFPFGHRDQWGSSGGTGYPEYQDWKGKRYDVRNNAAVQDSQTDSVTKHSEVLELMAGCVTIQGQSNDKLEHSHPDVIVYNVEEFPARTFADIFPWTMSSGERTTLRQRIDGGAVNAVLIHLCEGPDATSLAQFGTWEGWGLLDETTAIIHGTPLGSNEFTKMAAVGAKILWSPMSNMKLYETTANVKLAKECGVTVGLSPDWTPSGGYNMLEELGYAWYLSETMFSNAFTPQEMCEMVTIRNAEACGFPHRYGKVAVGYNAGLAVIDGDLSDPYMSLINARPRDVKLTIVNGMPKYGDPDLVQALGETGEYVNIWGNTKMLNIAFTHPFLNYSDQTYATIRANLQIGHGALTPSGELDWDELQFLDLDLLQRGPDNIPPFRATNPLNSPSAGAVFVMDEASQLSFRRQDFWDNETDSRDLCQSEIAIVPQAQPSAVVQVVTNNVKNYAGSRSQMIITVPFTPDFEGGTTNYVFRFITVDMYANARTTAVDAVTFTVVPEPVFGVVALVALVAAWRRAR